MNYEPILEPLLSSNKPPPSCVLCSFYKESVFSFCFHLRRDTNLHDEPVRHVVFAFQLGLWGWSFFSTGDSGSCDNPFSYHFLWAVYEWQDGWLENGQRATIVSASTKSSLKEAFKKVGGQRWEDDFPRLGRCPISTSIFPLVCMGAR